MTDRRKVGFCLIALSLVLFFIPRHIFTNPDVYWASFFGVKPKQNVEGMIDYYLIDEQASQAGADDLVKETWVLRFPEELKVNVPGFQGTGPAVLKGFVSSRRIIPNKELILHLDKRQDDFVFQKHRNRYVGAITVGIFAPKVSYDKYQRGGRESAGISSQACKKGDRINAGLYKIIPVNEENSKSRLCSTSGADIYHFYLSEKPVGYGVCYNLSDPSKPNCQFIIWLPQHRIARLFFSPTLLDDLPKIYDLITDKLAEATVTELSNIKWENEND